MNLPLRSTARALRREFSAAWFAVPVLLLVALLGAALLAGVLRELPQPSGTDGAELAAPLPQAGGA